MKIVLLEDVKGVGEKFTVAEVKNGYARNWLIPQGLALKYSRKNLKSLEARKKEEAKLNLRKKEKAMRLAEEIKKLSLTISERTKNEEELFGSVTAAAISEAFKAEGFDIPQGSILLEEPIKKVGVYDVNVRLHPEVIGQVKIWVVKK